MKTLYLCYFGLREPLVQTQVLPYLRELSRRGLEVYLLTFEADRRKRWTKGEAEEWRKRLAADGIKWFSLSYHKRPSALATTYDIIAGARFAARLARRERIDVLHARSHIPMAMAMLAEKFGARCRLLFDIRGLLAEEYADAGVWVEGSAPFRAVKRIERAGINRADELVVLTRKYRDLLVKSKLKAAESIEVIPCCVDLAAFAEAKREVEAQAGSARRFEVIYAGSVTGLYLLEEMGRFFLELRKIRPDAFFRVLTMSSAVDARARLARVGLKEDEFWVGPVSPLKIPAELKGARLGLSFRKQTFSQIAASPTKIPEYLAAGLPVICVAGAGDTDELLGSENVGVVLETFDAESRAAAAREALKLVDDATTSARCRQTARAFFDLVEVGGVRYRNVYSRIERKREIAAAAARSS